MICFAKMVGSQYGYLNHFHSVSVNECDAVCYIMKINWSVVGPVATVAGVSFLTGAALYQTIGVKRVSNHKLLIENVDEPQIRILFSTVEGTSEKFANQLEAHLRKSTEGSFISDTQFDWQFIVSFLELVV